MRQDIPHNEWKTVALVPELKTVFELPPKSRTKLSSPAIVALPGGRTIVSCDVSGPGVKDLTGKKGKVGYTGYWVQGRVFVSKDKGE
jgi:hypothetical protein